MEAKEYFKPNNWYHYVAFHNSLTKNFIGRIKLFNPKKRNLVCGKRKIIEITSKKDIECDEYLEKFLYDSTATLDTFPPIEILKKHPEKFNEIKANITVSENYVNTYMVIEQRIFNDMFNNIKHWKERYENEGSGLFELKDYPDFLTDIYLRMLINGNPVIVISIPNSHEEGFDPDAAKVSYFLHNPIVNDTRNFNHSIFIDYLSKLVKRKIPELNIENAEDFNVNMTDRIKSCYRNILKYDYRSDTFKKSDIIDIGVMFIFEYDINL